MSAREEGTGTASTGTASTGTTSTGTTGKGFRPDVEGLRAVAVIAVIAYHAGVSLAGGGYVGVDVFFVISGFLITGMLVREFHKRGTLSIAGFYVRRIKRLLPLAMVVLAFVAVGSQVFLAPPRRLEVSGDLVASGIYVVNWRLAARAVNYFAGDRSASPVQHFWSLAVEEQFYLVWPLLLLLVAGWWLRRARRRDQRGDHGRHRQPSVRGPVLALLALIGLASFGCSLYFTYPGTHDAYFSTLTRGWELAAGAALALVVHRLDRLPAWASRVLAAAGMASIAFSIWWLDDESPFPGALALLPVLGAAAIIAAGSSGRMVGPLRVLTWRPVRHVGRISYAWYLWHWPMLVFATARWGELSAWQGCLVVLAAWVPSVVSHRLVEEPLRRSSWLARPPARAFRFATVSAALVVGAGLLIHATVPAVPAASADAVSGAEAVHERSDPTPQAAARAVLPQPLRAKDDLPTIQKQGCIADARDVKDPDCVYGDREAEETVVLFGDSHMAQYDDVFQKLAHKRDWRLRVITKAACPPTRTPVFSVAFKREYHECEQWRDHAISEIEKVDPDMIVVAGRATYRVMQDGERLDADAGAPALRAGYVEVLRQLSRTDAKLVVMRDNPQPGGTIVDCVSRSMKHLQRCAVPKAKALDYEPVLVQAAAKVPGVHTVNVIPSVCPGKACPAVIGNALVYRDGNHLTATFVKTLLPEIRRQLPDL